MADLIVDAPTDDLLALERNSVDFTIYTAPMEVGSYPHLSELATALVKQDTDTLLQLPRPTLHMVGSSTEKDLQNDTMSVAALGDMTHVPNNLALWLNHDYTVPGSYLGGLHGTPKLVQQKGIADLHLDAVVEVMNPDAARTYLMIQRGSRFGCSVGCMVEEYEFIDANGETVNASDLDPFDMMFAGVSVRVNHVRVVEWSVVGIPANQRSWVENAIKGVFTRTLDPRLAPAVKSLWPNKYESLVLRHAPDKHIAKSLLEIPTRNSVQKRIWWHPVTKGFYLESGRAHQPIERDELGDVLEKTSSFSLIALNTKAADDADKKAQEARSKKYGIGIKEGGNVTKPKEFASVPDEQYGDPVNYAYPMPDKAHADNAAARWGDASNRSQYNSAEQKIIGDRIAARQRSFGETPDKDKSMNGLKTKASVDANGNHPPMTGTHTHAHPSFGVDEKGEYKSLEHAHTDDAVHAGVTSVSTPGNLEDHPGEAASQNPSGLEDHPGSGIGMNPGNLEDHPGNAVKAFPPASKVKVSADGTHEKSAGVHSHAHKAFGAQGDDEMHDHSHEHNGDADHGHSHMETKGAGDSDVIAERKDALKSMARTLGITIYFDAPTMTKAGKKLSEESMQHIQAAHDSLKKLTNGMVCGLDMDNPGNDFDGDGDDDVAKVGDTSKPMNQRGGGSSKTVQQAANEAAEERAASNALVPALTSHIDKLTKALESLGIKDLTEQVGQVKKDLETAQAAAQKLAGLEATMSELEGRIEQLTNVRIGPPTRLNRSVQLDPAAVKPSDLTGSTGRPTQRRLTLDEALALTTVKQVDGIGPCRFWPEGVSPKDGRPKLTSAQLMYMDNDDIVAYYENRSARVPDLEDL